MVAEPHNTQRYQPRLTYIKSPQSIEEEAARAGSQQRPPSSATTPSADEQAIIDHFDGEYMELNRHTTQTIERQLGAFAINASLPTEQDLTDIVHRSDAAMSGYMAENRTALRAAEEDYARRHSAYQYFRFTHKLDRDAKYPESNRLILAVLVFAVAVESILNGLFFARASEYGYIEGISVAIFVSLVNVLGSFLVGRYAFPHLSHRDVVPRRIARFAMVVFPVVVVLINLVVAHFRDLAETSPATAVAMVLPHTFGSPFALGFHSFVMFFIGLIAAGVGFAEGASWDDPYAGYGDIDRLLKDARTALRTRREQATREVVRILEAAVTGIDGLTRQAQQQVTALEAILESLNSLPKLYERDLDDIGNACTRVLKQYRGVNSDIRSEPPPVYFATFPAFPPAVDFSAVATLPDRLRVARAHLAELMKASAAIVKAQRVRIDSADTYVDKYLDGLAAEVKTAITDEARAQRQPQAEPAHAG